MGSRSPHDYHSEMVEWNADETDVTDFRGLSLSGLICVEGLIGVVRSVRSFLFESGTRRRCVTTAPRRQAGTGMGDRGRGLAGGAIRGKTVETVRGSRAPHPVETGC